MKAQQFLHLLATTIVVAYCGLFAPSATAVEASANVKLTSDYSARGISQTGLDPAIQGGFDITFQNGFSIGTWSSNVNFGSNTSQEIDFYASWQSDTIADLFTVRATLYSYVYPSEGGDYNEYFLGANIWSLSLGFIFTNEYFGAEGLYYIYPSISKSWTIDEKFSVNAKVGWNLIDQDDYFEPGKDSYMDASLSVTVPILELDVSGSLVGSTLSSPRAEWRFVFAISKSF